MISFKSSCSIGSDKIWIAGKDNNKAGKLYKSDDAGTSWNLLSTYPFLSYNDFFIYEDDIAYASSDSTVFKSQDGGKNWSRLSLPQLTWVQHIYFLNSLTGWMVSTPFNIYKTTDGGVSWNPMSLPQDSIDYRINDIYFTDENHCWVTIDGYDLIRTLDGGVTWTIHNFPNFSFNCVLFINDSTGIISGNEGEIYITNDGGISFQVVYQTDAKKVNHIKSYGSTDFWAVGSNGKIVRSNDGGNSWSSESSGVYLNHFTGMQFNNKNVGWISGDDKILKTTDGGNNWLISYRDSNLFIHSIYFLNDQFGWAISTHYGAVDGRLLRTTNGGENWETIWEYSPIYENKMFFVNTLNGWMMFDNSLMRTTDGGFSWELINFSKFDDIWFIDKDLGWGLSHTLNGFDINGIVSKTTDGGYTWIPVLQDSLDLLIDIIFLDNNLGVAVGGDASRNYTGKNNFLITMDGGANWQKKSFDLKFHRIQFLNYSKAVATVVENGIDKIILTKDAGISWEDQFVFSYGDFDGLGRISFIDSTTGWIGGTFSTLLKTTNGGVTFIEDENNFTQPKDFLLKQNYPNPFNPSTSIQYAISSTQFVTLKVYDLLGREVATLVNEEKPAGSYNAQFTINNVQLSSGIYFYKLQAGSFVETKKMILLK